MSEFKALYISEVLQIEATTKMITNALRTGRMEAAIAFTSVLKLRSRPKSRKTRRALSAWHAQGQLRLTLKMHTGQNYKEEEGLRCFREKKSKAHRNLAEEWP